MSPLRWPISILPAMTPCLYKTEEAAADRPAAVGVLRRGEDDRKPIIISQRQQQAESLEGEDRDDDGFGALISQVLDRLIQVRRNDDGFVNDGQWRVERLGDCLDARYADFTGALLGRPNCARHLHVRVLHPQQGHDIFIIGYRHRADDEIGFDAGGIGDAGDIGSRSHGEDQFGRVDEFADGIIDDLRHLGGEGDEDIGVFVERLFYEDVRFHAVEEGIAIDDIDALAFNGSFFIQQRALFRVDEAIRLPACPGWLFPPGRHCANHPISTMRSSACHCPAPAPPGKPAAISNRAKAVLSSSTCSSSDI